MILQGRRVWVLNDWMEAQIEISGSRIRRIYPYGKEKPDVDYGELRIVPGLIDVHTHGGYGFDTNDAQEEGLRNWAGKLVQEGVTGFLPTTVTQSEEVLTAALANVAATARAEYEGARILGVHLEGPWIDRPWRGAQPAEFCTAPDPAQFDRLREASGNRIRIVTMACEHDAGYALTRRMTELGIAVSLGHSGAAYEEAAEAFANGVRSVTHVYNGMAPFHHRAPGIVGASLRFHNVYGEIICDGRHSDWAAVYDFFRAKGPDHAVMVTDSLRVKGLLPGTRAVFGGNRIELCADGCARLVENDGRTGKLAGSALKMNEGLRNLVERAGVPWQAAINSCTCNPARLLQMEAAKGSLQAGKDADITVLRDDYSVEAVYVRGKRAW